MTDTTAAVHQLQLAIFNKMTASERIAICVDMMEEGQQQLEGAIGRKHPTWSKADIVAEAFRRMYRNDFTPEKIEEMADRVRAYYAERK